VAGAGGSHVLGITFNPQERADAPEKNERGHAPCYGSFDRTSILYKVDVERAKVLWRRTVPYPVGFRSNENAQGHDGFDFKLGPDGKVLRAMAVGARAVQYQDQKLLDTDQPRDWAMPQQ